MTTSIQSKLVLNRSMILSVNINLNAKICTFNEKKNSYAKLLSSIKYILNICITKQS